MPHHPAAGKPAPRSLRLRTAHPAATAVLDARGKALEATLQYALALAQYLPVAEGAPYDTPRGTKGKREAMLEEIYLPQALFDLLDWFPGPGQEAARAQVDTSRTHE